MLVRSVRELSPTVTTITTRGGEDMQIEVRKVEQTRATQSRCPPLMDPCDS
jgi:hypothetical protein